MKNLEAKIKVTTVLTPLNVRIKREIATAFQGHGSLENQKNSSKKK